MLFLLTVLELLKTDTASAAPGRKPTKHGLKYVTVLPPRRYTQQLKEFCCGNRSERLTPELTRHPRGASDTIGGDEHERGAIGGRVE
jgi:hypothetical protein